ncbi:MAG: winged helix-turn-helix transcriptional regulator [Clostridiaceae bacterium]|nr:winged helix-turn-helix transcriptional regulator [Clostridiaceae bacterium]
MSNELEILRSVEEKNTITQRELAKRTGLSLGSVNVLLKRLIHKGFVKIEHINAKTLRYVLTPKGLMEKARLTYKYIVLSYNYISGIEQKIESISEGENGSKEFILFGEKDELYEIITSKLKLMNKSFLFINDIEELKQYNNGEYVIIMWNPDYIENEKENGINAINILSMK